MVDHLELVLEVAQPLLPRQLRGEVRFFNRRCAAAGFLRREPRLQIANLTLERARSGWSGV